MPLFDLGFGPDQPSPQELGQVDSQVAIAKGTRDGLSKVATSAADALMAEPMKLADQLIGSVIEPANDAIGSASSVAENISAYGHTIALNAIQGPLAQGLAWGYQSQGTPLLLPQNGPAKAKRRKGGGKTGAAPPPILPFEPGIRAGGPTGTGPAGGVAAVPPAPGAGGGTGYGTGAPPFPPPPGFDGGGMPLPVLPGGGNLNPIFPGGGGIFQTQPGLGAPGAGPAGPGAGGIPGIPQPQPQPPQQCCPPGQITVNQAPPTINLTVPATIITTGPDGVPTGSIIVQPVVVPPPTINVSPTPIDVSLSCPGGQTTPTQPGPAGSGTLSTGPGGGTVCPSCSIPFLALKYPQFVIAERAAQKTDYDILVDAITLKLCCGNVDQPGCSMPFLERMVPEFVRAAKAQSLTDDQVLQQAVNIGLCKDEPVSTGLGEENVGYIAPGSAAALAQEFDPPRSGEAGRSYLPGQTPVNSEGNPYCWQAFVLPGPTDQFELPDKFNCLTGFQRMIYGVAQELEKAIKNSCDCGDGSFFQLLGSGLNNLWNTNTWYGKGFYYVSNGLLWVLRELACNTIQVENWFNALSGCQEGGAGAVVLAGIVAGIYKRWGGDLPDAFWTALNQTIGLMCPSELPSGAEANGLLATNFISSDDWDCLQRANGNRPDYQKAIVESLRRRPNDEELLRLQRAGLIDADTLVQYYAANGWTNDESWALWMKSQLWVPSTSDAIEWMLKDTQDKQIQELFLLGAEFKQKYTGRVAEAFNQNGVSKGDAETMWRAHWRNVSPELLYHMHKRLRPGWTALMTDPEVTSYVEAICPVAGANVTPDILASRPISNGFPVPTYCNEIPDAATGRKYLESITVTGYHASEALGQDDYPAFWRPRMLALSYNVLTRVDARRAYEIGLFTDAKLVSVYMDQGYKESDAAALTAFAHKQLVLKFTRSPTAKQWIAYPYDPLTLKAMLIADGMREDIFQEVFDILTLKYNTAQKIAKLKQAKRNVVGGRIDRNAAINQVAGILAGA